MKYTFEQQLQIDELANKGFSGRKIAYQLGLSKSGVNAYLGNRNTKAPAAGEGPRILFFDLETAPSIVATFGRFKTNIGQDQVLSEGNNILTASWKFLGDSNVVKRRVTSADAVLGYDGNLVAELYEVFEQSDIVVAHNAARFDVPMFKARLLVNGMPPHKTVKVLDTLQMAKHFRFPSNKLDSIAAYLELGRKIDTGGMNLWIQCMQGDNEALDQMLDYNAHDVVLLEQVYLKLRAFNSRTASLGQYYNDGEQHCPACGSTDLTETGHVVYTPVSAFEEMQCGACGHRSRTRSAINSKEQRQSLLITPKQSG